MIQDGFKGDLHDLVIFEVLKKINHSNSTGVLFIKSGNSIGSIYIKNRKIVYAKLRMSNEDESLKEILSLRDGEYNWQANLPPIRETIDYFIPVVSYKYLKEAIKGFNKNPAKSLPDYNKRLILSPDFIKFSGDIKFTADELEVLGLVKEDTTINSLLRTSDIGRDELLKAIHMLYLSDIIQTEESGGKKGKGSPESNFVDRLKGFGV